MHISFFSIGYYADFEFGLDLEAARKKFKYGEKSRNFTVYIYLLVTIQLPQFLLIFII